VWPPIQRGKRDEITDRTAADRLIVEQPVNPYSRWIEGDTLTVVEHYIGTRMQFDLTSGARSFMQMIYPHNTLSADYRWSVAMEFELAQPTTLALLSADTDKVIAETTIARAGVVNWNRNPAQVRFAVFGAGQPPITLWRLVNPPQP
jgi:hypothetical protein